MGGGEEERKETKLYQRLLLSVWFMEGQLGACEIEITGPSRLGTALAYR